MKKIFTAILAFMALALPVVAQESEGNTTSVPITLSSPSVDDIPKSPIHRAPMRICVEAWYDATVGTLSIIYYGEAEGEVNLYRDGELIDSSSAINTTFMVADPGYYSIEIITDSWTATGDFEI